MRGTHRDRGRVAARAATGELPQAATRERVGRRAQRRASAGGTGEPSQDHLPEPARDLQLPREAAMTARHGRDHQYTGYVLRHAAPNADESGNNEMPTWSTRPESDEP